MPTVAETDMAITSTVEAEAERLINECGYHRRDAELADAQAALLG